MSSANTVLEVSVKKALTIFQRIRWVRFQYWIRVRFWVSAFPLSTIQAPQSQSCHLVGCAVKDHNGKSQSWRSLMFEHSVPLLSPQENSDSCCWWFIETLRLELNIKYAFFSLQLLVVLVLGSLLFSSLGGFGLWIVYLTMLRSPLILLSKCPNVLVKSFGLKQYIKSVHFPVFIVICLYV